MNNKNDFNDAHTLLRIRSIFNSLQPTTKKVAKYILQNPEKIIHFSITELAKKANVSETTIFKFCKEIEYSGYRELKIALAQEKHNNQNQYEHIYGEIGPEDNFNVIIKKLFQKYNQSFKDTEKLLLDSKINESIDLFLEADRIYIFGFGASGIVARDCELKFKRLNYDVEALVDNHSQKTVGSLLNSKDLVIAISDSGRTKELIESVEISKNTGAKIITITSNLGSPITKFSDIVLGYASSETSFRGSAIASRMTQLAVIDVLFLGVATSKYDNTIEVLNKTRNVLKKSKI